MKADVVVVGGGPAGTACARAAAEMGAGVILVERYGFLGGNLTAALVGTIGGLFVKGEEGFDYVVGGIPRDCAETLKGRGQAFGPVPWEKTAVLPYVPFGLKTLMDEWMEKAGVRLHLHTRLTRVNLNGERIESIRVSNVGGGADVEGTVFVDASGDGALAFLAGASMEGSPVQFPSMNFFMANVNIAEALTAGLATLQTLIKEAVESGEYDLPRAGGAVIPTMRPGEVIVAMGRIARDGRPVDCADPLELVYAEKEGRRQASLLAAFLKAKMPGFAEAYVADTPTQVGARATRRLVGKYVLTASDVLGGASFDDAVSRCAWPVELHAEGKGTTLEFLPDGKYYQIPYRSLLPMETDNLLVAGRCLSASFKGHASARVSSSCMAMGEAAGVAAVLALGKGGRCEDVNVGELQAALTERGALV
jgi:choline dehydrogenase-like flavoprotein